MPLIIGLIIVVVMVVAAIYAITFILAAVYVIFMLPTMFYYDCNYLADFGFGAKQCPSNSVDFAALAWVVILIIIGFVRVVITAVRHGAEIRAKEKLETARRIAEENAANAARIANEELSAEREKIRQAARRLSL